MEQIDQLVQIITDRVLGSLQTRPDKTSASVYVMGKNPTIQLLLSNGFCLTADHEVADCLVFEELTLDALLRVASLCPTNEAESLLLSSLLIGRKVLVSETSFNTAQYKHQIKSLLYRDMLLKKAQLEAYGVTFYQNDELLTRLKMMTKVVPPDQVEQEAPSLGKEKLVSQNRSKLITETRLKSLGLSEGDVLKIEKGTIVTALARDYIKRHRIIVEK